MNSDRALRGSCHCGRNQYLINIQKESNETPQILFDNDSSHRTSQATTLAAFIRVPIEWYQSRTFAFFPDETRTSIRRTYSHPSEQHAIRQFCGFCGTPLSYWSERPRSEAAYIQLTLGSLLSEDLRDLEDLGLLSSDNDEDPMEIVPTDITSNELQLASRELIGLPWFDSLVAGSRLSNLRTSRGVRQNDAGNVRVEWEITEWTNDDDDTANASETSAPGKRKRQDAEGDITTQSD